MMGAARSATSKRALAGEVWKLMADFATANFRQSARAQLMEERGLAQRRTPPNDRRVKTRPTLSWTWTSHR
jgi:hypothetical protein